VAPGVRIAAVGRIEIADRAWAATLHARQADSQGEPSAEGASLGLRLNGPWRKPELSLTPRSD